MCPEGIRAKWWVRCVVIVMEGIVIELVTSGVTHLGMACFVTKKHAYSFHSQFDTPFVPACAELIWPLQYGGNMWFAAPTNALSIACLSETVSCSAVNL
jgi:hypothetical protein